MKTSFYIDFAQPISLPPYWLNHPEVVRRLEDLDAPNESGIIDENPDEVRSIEHACPLKMKWESEMEWWEFPIEPVVTISCKNNIVKRSVLKVGVKDTDRRGTVKELWSQDDYEISISGIFISSSANRLPEDDLGKLRAYCEGRESVKVESPLFTLFNIHRIAIEDYQLPFTKGMENQMFTIKATSDDFDEARLLIVE